MYIYVLYALCHFLSLIILHKIFTTNAVNHQQHQKDVVCGIIICVLCALIQQRFVFRIFLKHETNGDWDGRKMLISSKIYRLYECFLRARKPRKKSTATPTVKHYSTIALYHVIILTLVGGNRTRRIISVALNHQI